MTITFRNTIILTIILLSTTAEINTAAAQDVPGSTYVTWLRATDFYASHRYGDGDNLEDYVWWFWYDGVVSREQHQCIEHLNWDYDVHNAPPYWRRSLTTPIVGPHLYIANPYDDVQSIGMEAYEDDAGDICDYNTKDGGDEGVCFTRLEMRYGDYPPGMTNQQEIWCNDWALRFEFRYNIPVPGQPRELHPQGPQPYQICATEDIPLTMENHVRPAFLNDPRFRFHIEWQWSNSVNGPWWTLGTSTPYPSSATSCRSEIGFDYDLFKDISANTDFYYRAVTRMTMQVATAGEWAGQVLSSVPSEPNVLHISPPAPKIVIDANSPSCPNEGHSSGRIHLTATGLGQYIWSMRTGPVNGPCDPTNSNCGAYSGQMLGNAMSVHSIAPGSYTLMVTNYPASTRGVCTSRTDVTIGALPTLQTAPPGITSVTCPGGTDGALQINYTGGVTPWAYQLTKAGYDEDSDDGSFTALQTGTYTSTVTDGCQQVISNAVTVPEPLRITAATTPIDPTCTAPFNGAVKVDITQGEGTYSFKVIHDGETVDHLDAATVTTWTAPNLPDGEYTLEIRDARRLQCDATTLPPVSLSLPNPISLLPEDISQKNLTCFEQNDGFIQLSNVDLGGKLKYTITGQATGTQRALTTAALFDNLPADSYYVLALRNVEGCTDAVEIADAVVVTQPDEIVITLDKTDIQCFREDNGTITPSVAGSTPSDQYLWEALLDGDWATYNAGRTTLDHLAPGSYRLTITNASNCRGESTPVIIDEPRALTIFKIDLQDMPCYGGHGQIRPTVLGGTTPYTYHYQGPGGITDFSAATAQLPQGDYQLTVTDKNGCITSSGQQLTITEPPQMLAFTYTVPDINGYNITCAGARNGFVEFAAVGGNGPGYTGYQYALSDRPYQDHPRFDGMGPGPHTLFVRDARGCAVSKNIVFTEPASKLTTALLFKSNVQCQTDLTGRLHINPSGGVEPYTFVLNDTVTQATGNFTGIPAGEYTMQITDHNGCTTQYHDKIDVLHTPMTIALQTTDVTCYAGNNGAIAADVTGGHGTLRQQWTQSLAPLTSPTHLSAGKYVLTVTDAAGCVLKAGATIHQPEQINTQTTVIPVCVGKTTGEIWLQTTGGTGAYRYSADGNLYQESPILKNLAAGGYDVHIKDANNCQRIFATQVTVRNDLPKPDFLVASNENALDTLVVNEISIPKADSATWFFDPAIQVIDADSWAPQILVHEPGNYTVAMTGYFAGCAYTKTVTLTINPYSAEEKVKIPAPYETIQTMTATPNPTDGQFNITVALNAKQDIAISVIDNLGVEHYHQTWRKTNGINETINIKNAQLAPGIYILRAVTSTDAREIRIMIQQ